MRTIKLQVEDSFYDDMIQRGVDVQKEFKKIVKMSIYQKEYQIAQDIKQGIEDVKNGKAKPIEELLNAI